nr:MAG TPA: DNA pilot protein VP2 [Microviridae sp.]
MSATIGAAAISAGAGLLGSFFGANKQDKNAQAQRDWQEKMYLMDRDYNTASNQRKRWEEAGLNPNLIMNGSAGSVSGSVPSTGMSNSGETLAQGINAAGSSAAQMIAQQMDINAQKNVRAAESRKAEEEADYTGQMTESQRMQNMFLLQTLQAQTKNLELKNVYQDLENQYARDSLNARVDLVTAQNQSLSNRAYLDAMNAALADTQNRIAKVNLAWLPAEKQAGLANVIAQSALFAAQRGMAQAAARMYVSSAALNYANESGIKLDNDFRKATQQLSIDATNDASRWTQQKYDDTHSVPNKLWRWFGIDDGGSWLPAAGAYVLGKGSKRINAPKKVKGFH